MCRAKLKQSRGASPVDSFEYKEGAVRRSVSAIGLILFLLLAVPRAFGQKGCELKIVGTWAASDQTNSAVYRFEQDGTVRALTRSGPAAELKEIASAGYMLDDPKAPKAVLFREISGGGKFPLGTSSLDITGYDDSTLTVKMPGHEAMRWTRLDSSRYFIILAGRVRTFYDGSGPTFPMMVKTDGRHTQIDAVGTFPSGNSWAFGPIPVEIYSEFLKEPKQDSDIMFRLEINGPQYERGLKIVQTWERRVREGALLYADTRLDNILVAKQVTESLNQCGERIKLYKLDWSLEDGISSSSPKDDNPISRIPFLYFRELKRLNESLHVGDEKFSLATHSSGSQPSQ